MTSAGIQILQKASLCCLLVFSQGTVEYDLSFSASLTLPNGNATVAKALCNICKEAALPSRHLIHQAPGSFECFPPKYSLYFEKYCGYPTQAGARENGIKAFSQEVLWLDSTAIHWMAMAFKSVRNYCVWEVQINSGKRQLGLVHRL